MNNVKRIFLASPFPRRSALMGMPGGTSWLNETAAVLLKGKNHCIGETYVGWFIVMVTELSQPAAAARVCFCSR